MGTIRYQSTFYGQNSGIEYQFELHDLDYTGAATEVVLDANGVTIEYSDGDLFEGIRASHLSAVMKIANSAMETDITNLINKADKKLYIIIYKNSAIYWGGPVNLTGISIEQNSNPPFIKWQAMDWIGGLQNIKWDNTNWGIISAGLVSYTQVLADIFIKAYPSFANTFYMPSSILFSTATPVTSTQFSGTPDPFAKTLFNTSAYTDDQYKYSFTYHQVLEMLLTDWCAKVIYSDGIYRVIDLRNYTWATQWVEYFYDKNAAQVGAASSYDNTITYDADDYIWAVDPLLTTNAPYKIVKRTFRTELSLRTNDTEGYLIYRNGGRNFTESFFTGDILTGWLDYLHSPIVLQSEDMIQFSIRINVKSPDLLKKLKYLVVVINATNGATTQRLYNNGKFKRGVANNGVPEPFVWGSVSNANYLIFPYAGGAQSNFSFKFKPPYSSVTLSLCEYALIGEYINKIGSLVSGSNTIKNIDCSDLKIGMIVKGSNIPNGTTITNIYNWTNNGIPYSFIEISNFISTTSPYQNIQFYESSDIILNTDPSLISVDVDVSILPSGSVTTNEGAEYKATNSNEANLILELPDARVGDNINSNGKTSLRVNNGTSNVLTTNSWKFRSTLTTETATSILQKLVNNISELTCQSIKFYEGSLYYRQFYNPHNAILFTTNGIQYILVFNGGSYTLDSDEVNGTWWMITRTTGSTTGTSGNTGTKIGTKDIYKDVYPYLDVPKLDNDIKIGQYEVGNTTAVLSMIRGGTINLSELALSYIASDPQFAFQETGTTPTATNVKEGDICFTNANGKFWKYTNGAWAQQYQAAAAGTGVTTIGTIDSQTKSANGLVISGSNLVAQTADASNVGMVSTGAQTFAGAKTFSNNAFSSVVISSSAYTGNNGSHVIINPNITNNNSNGSVAIQTISGTISAGANNAIHIGLNLNSTYNAGAFTGTVFYDINLGRNNPNINISSGNLSLYGNGTIRALWYSGTNGFLFQKIKSGATSGVATNALDVVGDSQFGAASTPTTASARVQIIGANATTGSALLVTNSTPTTIIKADNNQDLYLGSSGGKVGFYAVTPIVRPATGGASATIVSPGAGNNLKSDDTFDGYTLAQVVKALRNLGLLT